MSTEFHCPHCEAVYRGRPELSGRQATCKMCGEKFRIELIDLIDDVDLIEEEPLRVRSGLVHSHDIHEHSQTAKNELTTSLLIVGGGAIGLLILVGVVVFAVSNELEEERRQADAPQQVVPIADPYELFDYSEIPVPSFPDLPLGQPVGANGVQVSEVKLQDGNQPGQTMTLRVYQPQGEFQQNSLACVLVGPAGSPLISGNSIDGSDYHDETLPYAEAGAVAITFSLDGPYGLNGVGEELRTAYTKFRDAAAGMVNCRNALEYALQKIPEVDPNKIVIAGHSSAGSLSLLFSVHEPRLAGCIAYCSAADVEARIDEILAETNIQWMLPGIEVFKKKSAPMNHIGKTTCPVFLFHARDDSNCPFTDSTRYHDMLQAAGKESEIKLVHFGEHYQSMIDEGIPSGIEWMRRNNILPTVATTIPVQEAPTVETFPGIPQKMNTTPPSTIPVKPAKPQQDPRDLTPQSPFLDL